MNIEDADIFVIKELGRFGETVAKCMKF